MRESGDSPHRQAGGPPHKITVRGKQLDEDGTARFILPAHTVEDITPEFQLSGFGPQQTFAQYVKFNILAKAAHPKVWFRAQAGQVHRGFDPASTNDWSSDAYTSICTNETKSIVEAIVDPPEMAAHVKLVVVQTNTPAFITVSPTLLNNGGGATPITLTAGSVPDTYTVEARTTYSDTKLATLRVITLEQRVVSIGLYSIQDPTSPATQGVTVPAGQELVQELNDLFEQTCVTFVLADREENIDFPYDGGTFDGITYQKNGRLEQWERQAKNVHVDSAGADYTLERFIADDPLNKFAGDYQVIFIRNSGQRYLSYYDPFERRTKFFPVELDLFVRGVDFSGSGGIVFSDSGTASTERVVAHEFAHEAINWENPGFSGDDGLQHDLESEYWPSGQHSLMRTGAPVLVSPGASVDQISSFSLPASPGRWLRRDYWKLINGGAGKLASQ